MATAESVPGSCGATTSWSSLLLTKSVASSSIAATCCSSSWVSKFDGSAASSCVAVAGSVASSCLTTMFSERNDVTKSWAFCISVLEGEVGKDSGPWDRGGVWGFRIIGGEFRVVVSVATSEDILIRLRGKKAGRTVVFLL